MPQALNQALGAGTTRGGVGVMAAQYFCNAATGSDSNHRLGSDGSRRRPMLPAPSPVSVHHTLPFEPVHATALRATCRPRRSAIATLLMLPGAAAIPARQHRRSNWSIRCPGDDSSHLLDTPASDICAQSRRRRCSLVRLPSPHRSGVVRLGAASCGSSAEAAGAGVEAAGLGAEAGSGVEDCGGVGGGEDGVEG